MLQTPTLKPHAVSKRAAEYLVQRLAAASAEGQLDAGRQNHHGFAVVPRAQFANALDVHDVRTMNPQEQVSIEARFHPAQRLVQQMTLRPDVKTNLAADSLDPVDVGGTDDEETAVRPDSEPANRPLVAPGVADERQKILIQQIGLPGLDALPRPAQRDADPAGVERLEQIVEHAGVECADGIPFVGCNEDNRRDSLIADGSNDLEAIDLRKMDVEDHEVGRVLQDGVDGRKTIRGFTDEIDIRLVLDQRSQVIARMRIGIGDDRADSPEGLHLP